MQELPSWCRGRQRPGQLPGPCRQCRSWCWHPCQWREAADSAGWQPPRSLRPPRGRCEISHFTLPLHHRPLPSCSWPWGDQA